MGKTAPTDNLESHDLSADLAQEDSGNDKSTSARPSLDSQIIKDDLYGKRSQLWSRDEVDYLDKMFFSALELISGLVCDGITHVLNDISIENHDAFTKVYDKRDRNKIYGPNTGLLTAGNHSHYVDDPVFVAAFIKQRYLKALRIIIGDDSEFQNWHYMPAAKENFFNHENPFVRALFRVFFGYTKTVPIARKAAPGEENLSLLDQLAFRRLEELLRQGNWINIFPEATRAFKHGELNHFKKGVGKLAVEAPNSILLPYGHDGMEQVSPFGAKMEVVDRKTGEPTNKILRTRQRIQVVFAKEPIIVSELVKGVPHTKAGYSEVAQFIKEEVGKCFERAKELNLEAIS